MPGGLIMADMPFDLYRYYHPDGASKDWGIRNNGDGTFTRRYGKTGSRLAETTTPYSGKTAFYHLKLVREKTDKGYQRLGSFCIDGEGKLSAMPLQPVVADEVSPVVLEPCIYWRIKVSQTDAGSPLLQRISEAVALVLDTFFRMLPDDSAWIVAFQNLCLGTTALKNASGMLTKTEGVMLLLFLLGLKKHAPMGLCVTLSHEDGVDISEVLKLELRALAFFDSDLETIRPIAEDLGLLAKRLDLAGIQSEVADGYF